MKKNSNHDPPRKQRRLIFLIATFVLIFTSLDLARAQLLQGTLLMGAPAVEKSEGTECASGLAINAGAFGMFCSDYCESDEDCTLPDWGCSKTTQGNGEPVKFCQPRRQLAHPEEETP